MDNLWFMALNRLILNNFRSYQHLSLDVDKLGAVFVGENGSGKTNILESINMLITGRSMRNATRKEMIQKNHSESYIKGFFDTNRKKYDISLGFSKDNKVILKKNGKKSQNLIDIIDDSHVISFGPNDSILVYGDPDFRRKFLNLIISQNNSDYLDDLTKYQKNLSQRNALLSQQSSDLLTFQLFEEQIAHFGSKIIQHRHEFLTLIHKLSTSYFHFVSKYEGKCQIVYKTCVKDVEKLSTSDVDNFLRTQLDEQRQRDKILGYTSTGPHRDDFKLLLDGYPFKSYGSQGQCRSMAIALKLASMDFLQEEGEKNLIILLDDAFSELDGTRKEGVLKTVQNKGQIFLTQLSTENVILEELPKFKIENGEIKAL